MIARHKRTHAYSEGAAWGFDWQVYEPCPLALTGAYSFDWLTVHTRHSVTAEGLLWFYERDRLLKCTRYEDRLVNRVEAYTDGIATFTYYFYPDHIVRILSKGWYTIARQEASCEHLY